VLGQLLVFMLASYYYLQWHLYIDEDAISTPLKMCFICDGAETPTQKLVQATSNCHHRQKLLEMKQL